MSVFLITQSLVAQTKSKVDKNSITKDAVKIKDYQGGSLYKAGVMDLVVLNGTYKEMGQQYGYLVKDKIIGARDAWKKIFVESGKIAYEDILNVIGMPVYKSVPKSVKDMYEGIAETSGLKLTEVVVMDNWIPLVLLGRRAGCSSYIAWGSKSTDGTAYMARNLDFPDFSRKLVTKYGVITVLNPVGSEYSLAGVGIAGTVTGFNDMMNSAGLYCEFYNGLGSIEPVWYSNRLDILAFMAGNLRNYSTIDELRIQFNTTKSNYPAIIGVCEPEQGVHFEVSPETYAAVAKGESSLRANQFMNESWGIPVLPGATGWFTKTRMDAWGKALISTGAAKVNEKVLMKVMNAPMYNPDGTLTGTGFSVFEKYEDPNAGGGGESGDVTTYQVITNPATRTWWFRIPTETGWLEIDFKKYFK